MKRIFIWSGIVLAAVVAVLLALPLLIDANTFRPRLESTLTAALGRTVHIGELKLALFSGGVTATDLSIADDPAFGPVPFIKAKQLKLAVELQPLIFSRKLNVTGITIDQPEIALVASPAGVWNFSTLGKSGATPAADPPSSSTAKAPLDLSIKLVDLKDGRLTVSRTGGRHKPAVLDQVQVELQNISRTSAVPFSMEGKVGSGGSIKLAGTAGPLDQSDMSATPLTATLTVKQLDLALSGLNDMVPGLSGVVSFEGTAGSDGKAAQVRGKLNAEKIKVARTGAPATRPVELDFAAEHNFARRSGVLSQADVHIASALAHVTGTYAIQGDSMALKMNLNGSNMPVTELQSVLPALGIVLPAGSSFKSGTMTANLLAEGPADRLVTTGSVGINNAKLSGFDMGRKMSVIERFAGIRSGPDTDVQTLSANIRYAPEGANIQNIRLVVGGVGEVSGAGTVSPQNALSFRMTAVVRGTGLTAAMGNAPIPFKIEGTASDPQFRPDIAAAANQAIEKFVPGGAGKAAGDILKGFLGGKKK